MLSQYLNYHCPCYFAEESTDKKGKGCKIYRYENMQTPYEKLKSLPGAEGYLRAGVTFAELDREAHARTDN